MKNHVYIFFQMSRTLSTRNISWKEIFVGIKSSYLWTLKKHSRTKKGKERKRFVNRLELKAEGLILWFTVLSKSVTIVHVFINHNIFQSNYLWAFLYDSFSWIYCPPLKIYSINCYRQYMTYIFHKWLQVGAEIN